MIESQPFHLSGPSRSLSAGGVIARVPTVRTPDTSLADEALAVLSRVEERTGTEAIVVGSVPFDPTLPARLHVPQWHRFGAPAPVAAPSPSTRIRTEPPGLDRDDPHYRMAVASALRGINAGLVRKVVLARILDLEAERDIDIDALRTALATRNAAGYTFSVELGTAGTLVGASPELVAATTGDRLISLPLAGTAARGATSAQDDAARDRLEQSSKDRFEHQVVVDALRAGFAPLCTQLEAQSPQLVATERVWHLGTTIIGRIRPGVSSLAAACAVHPTPAVCGTPQPVATDLIRVLEPVDRGGYAGLVGWMNSAGDGEWVLALRCALVAGHRLRLYAGAGVVAGSTPEAEHAETSAKFGTLLDAIQGLGSWRRTDQQEWAVSA